MEALVNKKPDDGRAASAGRPKGKSASATTKALIARNIQLAFGQVAAEPVPDRFLELLKRIDDAMDKKS